MIKKLILILFFILSIGSTFALEVVESTGPIGSLKETYNSASSININWDLIMVITGVGIFILLVVGIIWFIVAKIVKKIQDDNKLKNDLLYFKYVSDLRFCRLNSDSRFRSKNPLFAFLVYKKAKIYANTTDGKKFIGYYDGECVKKEGYFMIALEMRHSFFKRETDVVIMPYKLRNAIIKKNDDYTIEMACEGIDEVLCSDYYSIPILKNNSKYEKDFADNSNEIMENFYQKYVYTDVIKENIDSFRTQVKSATEMNADLQMSKKKTNNLQE